jgi:hypothetical protein
MSAEDKEPDERQAIEALLPWHATGTLRPRDANRVEQALAGDRELGRQSDLVREELVETIHLNETLRPPSARPMQRLFAAIDAEARATGHRRGLTWAASYLSSRGTLLRARLPGPQPPSQLRSWCKRP